MTPYDVKMLRYRIVGCLGLVLFSFFAIVAARSSQRMATVVFSLLAAVSLYAMMDAGAYQIDEVGVVHRSTFGNWQISWDEIEGVEVGEGGGTLVFKGGSKQFVLPSVKWWRGAQAKEAFAFVLNQLDKRGLKLRVSRSGDYRMMRNTRVRGAG